MYSINTSEILDLSVEVICDYLCSVMSSLRTDRLNQLSQLQWSPSLRFWRIKTPLQSSQTVPLSTTWTMSTPEECASHSPHKERVRILWVFHL